MRTFAARHAVLWAILLICLLFIPSRVTAGQQTMSGSCGPALSWQFEPETGTLTITGAGSMDDYEHPAFALISPAPWREVRHQIRRVSLPDGLTRLGNYAFADCALLERLELPASVEQLGTGALQDCFALSHIGVAKENPAYHSVDGVLYDSRARTLLLCPAQKTGGCAIPEGTLAIAPDAFLFCRIATVSIPSTLTEMNDSRPFYCCRELQAFSVAEGNPAFSAREGLLFNRDGTRLLRFPAGRRGDFALPEGVTAIGSYALDNCAGLTALTLPDSLLSIGENGISNCPALARVTVGQGLHTIGTNAFAHNTALKTITLSPSLTQCGPGAFGCCTALTAIEMAPGATTYRTVDGVLFAPDGTLAAYPAGRSGPYTIPKGTSTLAERSFWGADKLPSVTIPASVTAIGDSAFSGCGPLADLYYGGSERDWQQIAVGFGNDALASAVIHYGWGAPITGSCGPDVTWSLDLSHGTMTLSGSGPTEDFTPGRLPWQEYLSHIKHLTVSSGVTAIGSHAFAGCTALTDAVLPEGLWAIGEKAFFASGLTKLALPSSLSQLGSGSLADCRDLTAITVADGSAHFAAREGVLYDRAMTRLIQCPAGKTGGFAVPDGVLGLEELAFFSTGLTSLHLPVSLTAIAPSALDGDCSRLASITVEPGNPSYTDREGVLFAGTSLLRYPPARAGTVYAVPYGVTDLAPRAFGDCLHLQQVLLAPGVTAVGQEAFAGCYALTDAILGTNVTTIGPSAFSGCWKLARLTLPDTLQRVEVDAFLGCDSLVQVFYGGKDRRWNGISMADGNADLTAALRQRVLLGGLGGRIFQRLPGDSTLTFLLPEAFPAREILWLAGYDREGRMTFLAKLPPEGVFALPEAASLRLFLTDGALCPQCPPASP